MHRMAVMPKHMAEMDRWARGSASPKQILGAQELPLSWFRFSYYGIPELCSIIHAYELCYSCSLELL